MTRILGAWARLPNEIRKPIRDYAAIFLGLVLAGGILQQSSPDWHVLLLSVKAAAGLAAWRVIRSFATNTDAPDDPVGGP